ncbi:MAG: DNA repair protein RecN [Anaerolineae bacterium]
MLQELSIHDFAIISDLKIEFGDGFNILTGETGAGKSIILDAVSLILGGRADTGHIRAGAQRAVVEAEFSLDKKAQEALAPILAEHEIESEDTDSAIQISRELRDNGRNVCRVNGLPTRTGVLRDIGDILIGIHGQGQHLALLKPKAHLPLLDSFAGVTENQQALAKDVKNLRGLEKERTELKENEEALARRQDMLRFQVEEISAAALEVGEDTKLRQERTKLGNVESLMNSATEMQALLTGLETSDGEVVSVSDMLGQAVNAGGNLTKLDETQSDLNSRLETALSEIDDIAASVRKYQDGLEHDPSRLSEIEERLDLINALIRKYGTSIAAVLETGEKGAVELEKIENSDKRLAELDSLIETGLKRIGRQAKQLSSKRKKAAEKLAKIVEKELSDLKMTARFEVAFEQTEDPAGVYVEDKRLAFDRTGIDKVEFMISSNPGEPLKPMVKVASGGETARLMLALKTALAQVDSTPTLIFDEIDQGIGGRIGAVVGEKLWSLSGKSGHQVICVTHLPQMAGFGDVHFKVNKKELEGRTTTAVNKLEHHERIEELADMLGVKDDLGKVNARSLLQEAEKVKTSE